MPTDGTAPSEPTREQQLRLGIAALEREEQRLERIDAELNEKRGCLAHIIGKMYVVIGSMNTSFVRGVTDEFFTEFRNMSIYGETGTDSRFWCKILVAEGIRRVELWLLPGDHVRVMIQEKGYGGKLYEIRAYETLAEAEAAAVANR